MQYKTKFIRFLAAFLGAFYVVLFARLSEIRVALVTPAFYIAFFVSFFIGLLLVNIIHQSWRQLDSKYTWIGQPIKRFFLQLLFGIAIPACFDILLIAFYYVLKGKNIFYNGFFRRDFPVVLYLLLFFNVVYACYYYFSIKRNTPSLKSLISADNKEGSLEIQQLSGQDNENQTYEIRFKGLNIRVYKRDILLIYREERKLCIITNGKGIFHSNDTLATIEKSFPKAHFSRINRKAIINISAVKGYHKGARRGTLLIVLQDEFEDFFHVNDPDILLVTKEYQDGFQKLFTAE